MPTDESPKSESRRFLFPKWANYLLPLLVIGVVGGALYVPVLATLGLSPDTLNVGYQPKQPIPYSHKLHADDLGIDCRYCHTTVDKGAKANIPHTQVCINCHNPGSGNGVRKNSEKLQPLFDAYNSGKPVEWIRVHDLPDYVYFNHSAHVTKGVSCVECHGRIDKMETVYQAKPLSMSWCLSCHRNPEPNLRPPGVSVTDLGWDPTKSPLAKAGDTKKQAQLRIAQKKNLKQKYNIHDQVYMTSCSTCHR